MRYLNYTVGTTARGGGGQFVPAWSCYSASVPSQCKRKRNLTKAPPSGAEPSVGR